MNTQTTAREARNTGMQKALSHAIAVQVDWPEQAMNALRVFINEHPGKTFMTEDLRAYAYDVLALPYPPHERAWGAIIAKAARQELIRRVGIAPVETASSHMANASVWRAA